MRLTALLLILSMLSSSLLPAVAGANPLFRNDEVCEDARKKLIEQGFYKSFEKYYKYKTGKSCLGEFCQALYTLELSRLRKIIFKSPGSPEYKEALRFIDSQHALDPQLINDLAQLMQQHWEAKFGLALMEKRAELSNASTETGAILGAILSLSMAALIRKPALTGQYNKLFRALFPYVGAKAGNLVAKTGVINAAVEANLPPAPAHLITLGVSEADATMTTDALSEETLKFTAALTAGTIVAETLIPRVILAFRAANAATAPAKVHPYVLLSSVAALVLVETGAYVYEEHKYNQFVDELVRVANELADAASSNEKAIVLSRAEDLTIRAISLAGYLKSPLLNATLESAGSEARARQEITDSQKQEAEIKRIQAALSAQIASIEEQDGIIQDREAMSLEVLRRLQLFGSTAAPDSNPDSQAMSKSVIQGFEPWLDRGERRAWMTLGTGRREALFQDYLAGLIHAKQSRLALELLDGQVTKNASRILLQAELLIRSLNDELIEHHADRLRSVLLSHVSGFPSAWRVP